MTIQTYSHNDAKHTVDKQLMDELIGVLTSTEFKMVIGSAERLRRKILTQLKTSGWSDDFKLDSGSQISLTSSKNNHVLCFQTGNVSRFYADLLKLEYVFKQNKTKAAFYLIPSKTAAKALGSNIAHFDRLTTELNLFRSIITIPILVIGIN